MGNGTYSPPRHFSSELMASVRKALASDKVDPAASAAIVLGKMVRLLRKQNELTQETLAEEAGVSRASINEIESGKGNPTLSTIAAIADALEVEISDLLP